MGLLGQNKVFGLDIGFETLRLVELKKSGGIYLRGACDFSITQRILEKDRFRDKAATAEIIKKACREAKPHPITAKKIVTALPETFVFSKTIQMPKMTDNEYEEAIAAEASQYLPIPTEEVYLDYQILIVHPDEPFIDILLVAAPKRLVDDYAEVAKMAGCELAALETKPLAVGRAIIPPKNNQGLMIIEIGTEISRISIWDNGKIRLTTTVGVGKNQIAASFGANGNNLANEPKSGITAETLSPIIDEISAAIRYHQNRDYQPKPIEKILLCGSGTNSPGIDKTIETASKIKTEIVAPKLSGRDQLDTGFITAYGLALRNLDE
jgi:type IV pilus assembly protein PilM